MNAARIYVAGFENVTIGTAAQSIMEVQAPDNTIIEVLHAWLSPAITATPIDEIIAISLYGNDAAATSGTTPAIQPLTPAAAADPSNCTFRLEGTIGATPFILHPDAYHLQNGWSESHAVQDRRLAHPDMRAVRGFSASPASWAQDRTLVIMTVKT